MGGVEVGGMQGWGESGVPTSAFLLYFCLLCATLTRQMVCYYPGFLNTCISSIFYS